MNTSDEMILTTEDVFPTLLQTAKQRIETIPLSVIVSGAYQRELAPNIVASIIANFDPGLLGVLVVNHRSNGEYAIMDGQHRLAALRNLGIDEANCVILEGLTPEEEADYFRFQNENRRPLTAYDKYDSGVRARDPHFIAIDALLNKYGFRISKNGAPGGIAAIDSLTRITQMYGFGVLEQVLASIKAAWPTDVVIVRREMLSAMAEFMCRFGKKVSVNQFASRMKTKHPSDFLYEAQQRTKGRLSARNAFSKLMRFTLCGVLVDEYNTGLGSKSKYRLYLDWDNHQKEDDEQ